MTNSKLNDYNASNQIENDGGTIFCVGCIDCNMCALFDGSG